LSAGIIFFSEYCCVFALSKDGQLTMHNIDGNKNTTVALADSSVVRLRSAIPSAVADFAIASFNSVLCKKIPLFQSRTILLPQTQKKSTQVKNK